MYTLHVEHDVRDYDAWKKNFDSDPADRAGSGVRSYRVSRQVGDLQHVVIDLEFDSELEAEALKTRLSPIWSNLEGNVIAKVGARTLEVVEEQQLRARKAA